MASLRTGCIVIGIGNPDRGDDAAGRAVARRLRGMLSAEIDVEEHGGEATALLARLEAADRAYLIDACSSSALAGTVRRFDVGEAPLPREAFAVSSHGLGLAEAIELGRTLGQLPSRCIVYAIEAASFRLGAPLSPRVAAAVSKVSCRVQAEIEDLDVAGAPAHA
jgi:hydrogenase maturation protease